LNILLIYNYFKPPGVNKSGKMQKSSVLKNSSKDCKLQKGRGAVLEDGWTEICEPVPARDYVQDPNRMGHDYQDPTGEVETALSHYKVIQHYCYFGEEPVEETLLDRMRNFAEECRRK
jgi:hypothetical protein